MKANNILLLILLFISNFVFAQSDGAVLPSEIKQRTVVNELLTLKKGYWQIGTVLISTSTNKNFDENGIKITSPENRNTIGFQNQLFATVGVSDRLQFEVIASYFNQQLVGSALNEYPTGLVSERLVTEINIKGIGDTNLILSYQLLKEDLSGSGLLIAGIFGLPTGEADFRNLVDDSERFSLDGPVGSGDFSISPRIRYRKVLFPFSLDVYAEYKIGLGGTKVFYVPDNSNLDEFSFAGDKIIAFYTNFNVQLNDWIALKQGLSFLKYKSGDIDGLDLGLSDFSSFQYFPNVSFQIKQLRIEQAVSIPLSGKNYPADIRFVVLAKYLF